MGPKSGSWWLSSKDDPRWVVSGTTKTLEFSAGPPLEAQEAMLRLRNRYGDPPSDLEWGGIKD